MNLLRSFARIAINRFGYEVRRVATPDTSGAAEALDPITLEYMKDRRGRAIMEVPIGDLRAFHALALPLRADCHPFVRAVGDALRSTGSRSARAAIEKVLGGYYEQVQPASAADVLGVGWEHLPGLRPVSPDERPIIDVAAVPWSWRSPTEIREGRRRTATFEGLQNGILATVEDGVTNFGPVKPAKLELEVDRLFRLLESVGSRGFDRFNARAPLRVAAFRRGQQYKWVINSGQHRFATAAAFEIEALPAIVTEVIRREDACYWPQVVSGVFTPAGATSIFDRIFDGVAAPACRAWIDGFAPTKDRSVAVG